MKLFDTLRYRGNWQSGIGYTFGDIVEDASTTINYLSYAVSNTGQNPSSSPNYWTSIGPAPGGTPAKPATIFVANSPVTLSGSGGSVDVVSITLPPGVWYVEAEVGNLTVVKSYFGPVVDAIFPLYLRADGKYEGMYHIPSGVTPSGITLSTTQGPGSSGGAWMKARPVVAP